MSRFRLFASDEMLIAIALWICILPFVLLLTLPAIGVLGSSLVSLAALALLLVFCWFLCRKGNI